MSRILITGGAGYVGNVLTPHLLTAGYDVTVYDILYFGRETLPEHPRLRVIEGDIRDKVELSKAFTDVETVLHLACISNDPSFALDEGLSRTINYDCFEPMVIAAKQAGVRRFVYCSTSSVYGVSDAPDVTEDHPLVPNMQIGSELVSPKDGNLALVHGVARENVHRQVQALSRAVAAERRGPDDDSCKVVGEVLQEERLAHSLVLVVESERDQGVIFRHVWSVAHAVHGARGAVDEAANSWT